MDKNIELKDILDREKKIVYQNEVDQLLWCASKIGKYKVNLGYEILRSRAQNVEWPSALCWHKMVLPKARAFLWTALHGRILIGDRLKTIGIAGPSFESVRSQTLKRFLLAWPSSTKKSKWSILWVVSLALLVWHIWKERNQRVFNGEALSYDILIPKIEGAIKEVINVKVVGRKYCTYSSWDKQMERLWNLTKNSGYKLMEKKQNRDSIVWFPPLAGNLKVNFDGASQGNPGKSGYGAIIRDELGNFVGANFGPLGINTNNLAELARLLAGLEWCVDQGFHDIEVEGDSQIILNGMTKQKFENWKLEACRPKVQRLCDSLNRFTFKNIY
ncbi:uncharacterized protein LOC131876235 [Cryptomeria japonica]|uniref:uncharacterized protein LOC131876235 n=1 Tax=Cryptomeria japonica TaxID=3369 RepID=UPI0027DA6B68|nr:uncharacterized protein LOC131876235 [Cryptomeria japonica]